jgi:hypothetical protein
VSIRAAWMDCVEAADAFHCLFLCAGDECVVAL